jgi:hypothetical protein
MWWLLPAVLLQLLLFIPQEKKDAGMQDTSCAHRLREDAGRSRGSKGVVEQEIQSGIKVFWSTCTA